MNREAGTAIGPSPVVAVLAGGLGSRLGGAKAIAELAGRPLISYPLAAAREAGLAIVVVARRDSPLPALGERVLIEPDGPRHPLRGVLAVLRAEHPGGFAGTRAVLAIGCDMPFLTAALLRHLADAPGGTLATRADGRLQPLPARYMPADAPALQRGADGGRSMSETLSSLRPAVIDEPELSAFGDPRRLLLNVNDAADLERAVRLLG